MNRLNYFNPYESKSDNHEDRFTRGLMALLRLSPLVATYFYSVLKGEVADDELPVVYQFSPKDMEIGTQQTTLPPAERYYSVVISDDHYEASDAIERVDRDARYDGVLKFGEAVFFVEVKPFKGDVWKEQLCPSRKDLPEDAHLAKTPITLSTRTVLRMLSELLEHPSASATERQLINDFRLYVNEHHPELNPFDTYADSLTYSLAQRKTEAMLNDIAVSGELVKYHQGWGHYIDIVDQPEIRKIGLLVERDRDSDDWTGLTVAADFGSTQGQAKAFYGNGVVTLERIKEIASVAKVSGNLHLAKITSNVIHFVTPEENFEDYFNYWKANGPSLRQIKRGDEEQEDGFREFYQTLKSEGLIEPQDAAYERKVVEAGYKDLNVCPSVYFTRFLSREEVIALEKSGELTSTIVQTMQEILGLLNREITIFNARYQR